MRRSWHIPHCFSILIKSHYTSSRNYSHVTSSYSGQNYYTEYEFITDGSVVILTNYIGRVGAVIIPDELGGLPVAAILGHFFCSKITHLTISDRVTYIEGAAVQNQFRLCAITVNDGNPVYSSLDGVLFSKDQADLVAYPSGKVGSYVIPYGTATIHDEAFRGCTNLTGIVIPASVISIGRWTFNRCTSLTDVTIPSSVINLDYSVFMSCTGLASINVDELSANYSSKDGVLFNKNQTILVAYPAGKVGSYAIPDDVTIVASYAFRECSLLTGIVIPHSVINLGDGAFL